MGVIIEQLATLYDSVIGVWFVTKLCGGSIKNSKFFSYRCSFIYGNKHFYLFFQYYGNAYGNTFVRIICNVVFIQFNVKNR